jgi:drug/metabolite transporter (DMT)-like permease
MIGIVLALLSAAASGLSVVLVGKHSKESSAFNVSLLISCVGLVILWPLAAVFTDFRAASLDGIILFGIGGMLTPGLVRLFYYSGLKKLGTSVNSSIFSVYPLYSALLAVLLLNEILTLQNWIGVFSIVLGVVFVEMNSREINGGNKSVTRSLVFPVLGGVTLGASTIIRKYALNLFNAPVLGIAVAYSFSFLPYALMLALHKPTRKGMSLKKDFRFFWAAGVGQAVSWILSFYALSMEEVSVITPLLSIEPLFVTFFAYFYLRELEFVSPKLVASIILTVFGVILVTTQIF